MKEQNKGTPNVLKKIIMQILRCKQSLKYFKAKTIWSKDGHLNLTKSRSPFNDRQKEFLNEIFEEGEWTGIKVNPDTVAKTMRRARNETTNMCFRCQNLWNLNKWPPTLAEKKIANPKSRRSSAGCLFYMCQIQAKLENKGTLPSNENWGSSKYSKGT